MIDGVKTKNLKVVPDERGWLMEILRNDDDIFENFGQVYMLSDVQTVNVHLIYSTSRIWKDQKGSVWNPLKNWDLNHWIWMIWKNFEFWKEIES